MNNTGKCERIRQGRQQEQAGDNGHGTSDDFVGEKRRCFYVDAKTSFEQERKGKKYGETTSFWNNKKCFRVSGGK